MHRFNAAIVPTMTPITEFYKNRAILITGATGFMGKVLLEKLLRTQPEIRKVYILLRPKKGLTSEERVVKLTSSLIFSYHDFDKNYLMNKIEAVNGDITVDGLGISESDKCKLIDDVSIVFHVAASVRMNLSLKEAVLTNTKSTYQLFKFCLDIKNLVSLVHLSTAYCNVEISNMEEKVYPVRVSPYKIIEMVELLDERSLNKIENTIIEPHPNTYTFTKRLSEVIAMDMGDRLPLVIVRPSIVTASVFEPTPGWIDNFYGMVGICLATGTGILRIFLIDTSVIPQTIPVDIAINNSIIIAYERGTNTYTTTPVFNVTQGSKLNWTWQRIFDELVYLGYKFPLQKMLWYPIQRSTTNLYVNLFYAIFFHYLPAFFVDFLLIIFLQKPFLVAIQHKLYTASQVLYHFAVKKWDFSTIQTAKITEKLCPDDARTYYTLTNVVIDMEKYLRNSFFFARKYLFKEDLSNVKYTRILLKMFYVLDVCCKSIFFYWVFKAILKLIENLF